MSTWFIVNPISGAGKGRRVAAQLEAWLERENRNAEVRLTHAPGHATQLAKKAVAEEVEAVVAVGGDGTMNEVAKALIGTTVCMGLIPIGSGNGLARHLDIPMNTLAAYRHFWRGRERRIDTGTVNGHPFVMLAGVGFDATIARAFSQSSSRGLVHYAKLVIENFQHYPEHTYQVRMGGGPWQERTAWMLTLANGSQFGNDFLIAPKASLTDGLLDLCAIRKFGMWQALGLARRMRNGTLPDSPLWDGVLIKELELTGHDGWVNIDGEGVEIPGTLHFQLVPESLTLRC